MGDELSILTKSEMLNVLFAAVRNPWCLVVRLQPAYYSRTGKVTNPANHLPDCSILGSPVVLPPVLGHHAYY